jgi:hypothetical protein
VGAFVLGRRERETRKRRYHNRTIMALRDGPGNITKMPCQHSLERARGSGNHAQ